MEPPRPCRLHHAIAGAGGEEIAGGEDRHVAVPQFQRRVLERRSPRRCRRCRRGCRRRQTEPARREPPPRRSPRLVTSIATPATASLAEAVAERGRAPRARLAPSMSASTTQAPSPINRAAIAEPMPPAPPVMNATRPASDLGFGIRCSLASSSNQYSMSNASCSAEADIFADAGGAAHDVDRVDVEFAAIARRRLVLGEGQHADAAGSR